MIPSLDFPTLFQCNHTGTLLSWRIWVEGSSFFVEHGQDEGKKIVSPGVRCKPKNKGKANATTSKEQATKEAAAKHLFMLRRKYYPSRESALENRSKFKVMLAHEALKFRSRVLYPVGVQKKYDGVRFTAIKSKYGITMYSRTGLEIDMPHVKKALQRLLLAGDRVDGEFYVHGLDFPKIVSLSKNPNSEETKERLKAYIFDIPTRGGVDSYSWEQREVFLRQLKAKYLQSLGLETSILVFAKHYTANCWEEVMRLKARFLYNGYEGLMLRDMASPYVMNRTTKLLKLKEMMDDEFEVIGAEGGKGKAVKCVRWWCQTKKGVKFPCVMKCSVPEREKYLRVAGKYIGRMLTVKFWEISKKGAPRFPVGLRFKE